MPGDISRDFGASLSRLYAEVETLKKSNKMLLETVENLVAKIEKNEKRESTNQRGRVLRAAYSQDAEEIEQLKSQATDVTEQEVLRLFAPVPPMDTAKIQINQTLVDNMRKSSTGKMPVVTREEPIKPVPYVLSEAFRQDENQRMLRDIEISQNKSRLAAEQKRAEKRHQESNMMRKLSPLWDI